jgi:hypothetical protein
MKTSNENEGKLHSGNLPEPGDSQNEKTTIQLTLNFIEDFLNAHFNGGDKVPAPYLSVIKQELNKQTAKLVAVLSSSEAIDRRLCDLLFQNFNTLIPENPRTITSAELAYRRNLIAELLIEIHCNHPLLSGKNCTALILMKAILFCMNLCGCSN